MNSRVLTIDILIGVISCCFCLGSEPTNVIAASAWSEPTGCATGLPDCGLLRGRVLILEGKSAAYAGQVPETQVYLELQNVSTTTGTAMEVYFDPRLGLRCEVRDSSGRPPPQVGQGGSGAFPSACWVTLPYDSTIRVRASWYGYGNPREGGLKIPLVEPLVITGSNTNSYYLSGTFSAQTQSDHVPGPNRVIWQGTLKIPAVKVWPKRG